MNDEWEISDKIRMDSNLEKIYDSFDDIIGKTGPTVSINLIPNESSSFKLFFDEEIISYIKKESLDYMEKITKKEESKKIKFGSRLYYLKNYNINNEDIYAYLALRIYMGIVKIPKKEMYWSTSNLYHNNFISSIMPKCYFKFLESSLHFVELNEDEELLKKNDPRYKLGKLMELLNERFYKYYILNQNITIDETMVHFKGTNSMKFYIPSKPHKWGFKLHLLSESLTGYTSKVLLDPGKKKDYLLCNNIEYKNERILKSEKIIFELLDSKYHNKGYHLYIDSWYSSISCIEKLQKYGFCVTGMISDNRIKLVNFLEKNLEEKETKIFYNPKLHQNLIIHKDKRILKLITNFKYNNIDEGRRPYAIIDYTDNMHGVDYMNLKTSYYSIGEKCYKWYKYIFSRMVEISLENSRIIFNKVHNKKKTIFEFRENVMLQLLENYHKRRKGISNKVFLRNKHLVKFSFFHLPVKKNKFEFCKSCDCKITKNFCEDCKVFLCINCYKNYHMNKFKTK